MSSLSVCFVTYNEEKNIEKTLQTVLFANELIVIDSYSSDGTVRICKKYTDKIYLNSWEGCGIQKKLALEKSTCEWVLILDADERLSPELQAQIQEIITHNPQEYNGFTIPFKTFYLGKNLKYGSCYKEKHLRLFKRNSAEITPNYVHFGLAVAGKIGHLTGIINHYSFISLEQSLKKVDFYSELGAKDKLIANPRNNITLFTAISHGLFTFFKGYILKFGFLDGVLGFIFAFSNAEASYYKYIKLLFLQNNIKNYSD